MSGGGITDFIKETVDFVTTPGSAFGAPDRQTREADEARAQANIEKARSEVQAQEKALEAKRKEGERAAEEARLKEAKRIREGIRRSTNILTSSLGLLDSEAPRKPTTTLLD
jgi:uncharacterized protein YlxW (UPF0749 family)